MKVNQAEFIISAVGPSQYPEDALPEIALAGRSNVGKSSLINCMISRKNLARTSSQPGKTQTLNYYKINQDLYFVDLPGYGYAKVSKTKREQWGKFIESYLMNRETLRLVMQLVDLRHPPSKDDQAMYEWLRHNDVPVIVIATKADKIPKSRWPKHIKIVRETLGMDKGVQPLMFSSELGLGKDELWGILEQAIAYGEPEPEEANELVIEKVQDKEQEPS
ncbi:ribosome biogenesis GTP-binding protein YihA/YsxC [Paenibacillus alginolyticus]|uniref:Probable GTP-binding protein EngB n=1 Tax=Paenibacillus alginolyticus TaxID=59839 RepID=A0ABT4GDN2_9BACL|nr:ribosome biogenesis GTP-binding protein YihA/YsxC [Paenibacillus alginolyticus]MCY9663794.1 ribosome biogenesis GTP-binding protein YihA/YsxC [Paenibacillus alginolyticus]MCY9694305.1 ribosome biogenesis GTP-binding protein YihA/YsxC [Paenibacillus alginolyticus]MEC0142855.1 ribosome biogenesis GTP-binding protein YihA/YsxC [Paenibacillus alginolyticus]